VRIEDVGVEEMDRIRDERSRDPVGHPDAPATVIKFETADLAESKCQRIGEKNRDEN
jgi:hypothetical protein